MTNGQTGGLQQGFLACVPKEAAVDAVCVGVCTKASAKEGLSPLHRSHVVVENCAADSRKFAIAKADLAAALAGPYKVVVLLVGGGGGVHDGLELAKERGWPVLALPGTETWLQSDAEWAMFPRGGNGAEFASFLHIHLTISTF